MPSRASFRSLVTVPSTAAARFGGCELRLVQGDLTQQAVDAIVNAANSSLQGGGGVDGAIHRAGGPAILEECRRIVERQGTLPAGEAVITTAGRLPCRHVIHTVGPRWRDGTRGEAETLGRCYANSLRLARAHGLRSVAFPSISTGAYGYPLDQAAAVALGAVRDDLTASGAPAAVRFVLFSPRDYAAYGRALASLS
jgi:O-acetyl-ADP-ribose deacetylase (regulator of RNase III)